MFEFILAATARSYYFLRRITPTNILIDVINTRRGLKWGMPALLLAAPYGFAAVYWETEMSDVDRILAVNFKGIFHGCKWAAKKMIEQRSGTIVNTGSFFGKVGHAGSAAYGAAKAGVHTLTSSLALEIAPYGVTVTALCPGLAATEMHWSFVEADAAARGITVEEMKDLELAEIPLGRYGYGPDMAGAIMWLSSQSGSYVTGQSINVNGGLDFS